MKFTIIIPTMWYNNAYLKNMVLKYAESSYVEEILIVNNRKADNDGIPPLPKVRMLNDGNNLFVNPSWNLGAKEAKTEGLIFANDDLFILNPEQLIEKLAKELKKGDIIGLFDTCFSSSDSNLRISPTFKYMNYGFGTFMAIHKHTFKEIPKEFKVWYGDQIMFLENTPKVIKGAHVVTEMRGTSRKLNLDKERKQEKEAYEKYLSTNHIKNEINVVLVYKKGKDFSIKDVYTLASKLNKTYQGDLPLNVYCITDIVQEEEQVMGLTLLPMQHHWPGWWSKMNLFSPDLIALRPFVFFDLDTVILKDIRYLQFLNYPNKFIMLSDFYRPDKPASGVMHIPKQNPKIDKIWDTWIKNPQYYMKQYRGDQEFIGSITRSDIRWQALTHRIGSFKPIPRGSWLQDPGDKAVICFHGKPKIPEAAETVPWVENYLYGK